MIVWGVQLYEQRKDTNKNYSKHIRFSNLKYKSIIQLRVCLRLKCVFGDKDLFIQSFFETQNFSATYTTFKRTYSDTSLISVTPPLNVRPLLCHTIFHVLLIVTYTSYKQSYYLQFLFVNIKSAAFSHESRKKVLIGSPESRAPNNDDRCKVKKSAKTKFFYFC